MHLILTGATGLVGSAVLHEMLSRPAISKISVLSRNPVLMADGHENVQVIIHKDFREYPGDVMDKLKGAEGVVWALGISANDVSKEMYEEITFDYSNAAAKAFAPLADPFRFVYVSGEGATTTPSMLTPFFGIVKGRAEASLLSLSHTPAYASLRPFSLRPGGIDPAGHSEILPFIPQHKGLVKKLATRLLPVIKTVYSNGYSPTRDLARVLVDLAMGDGKELEGDGISGSGRTLSNKAMRRLAGI